MLASFGFAFNLTIALSNASNICLYNVSESLKVPVKIAPPRIGNNVRRSSSVSFLRSLNPRGNSSRLYLNRFLSMWLDFVFPMSSDQDASTGRCILSVLFVLRLGTLGGLLVLKARVLVRSGFFWKLSGCHSVFTPSRASASYIVGAG